MPFKKTSAKFTSGKRSGQRVYRSPSGHKMSAKQVKAYYAKKGSKKK